MIKDYSFSNIQDVINWLVNHPGKHIYDNYAHFVVWVPNSNVIEYYYDYGEWEDEDGNYYPSEWDFDRMNIDEFIERFDANEFVSIEI